MSHENEISRIGSMIGMTPGDLVRRIESRGQCTTVRELIEQLESCDPDALVMFTANYGDYHNTIQALPVATVEESDSDALDITAYSNSGLCVLGEGDRVPGENDDPDAVTIVLLGGMIG